ncbi:YkgJ family cysteine cluster protein [Methanoplanus endosymbiosus]|uniref:YkgJ family cysteine cluster protein n=1 Tax=Methanoplanus endosymbiosus TaxID=33865 RepID=A0A9E7PP42_9EURY|nr:YkgJ family cysteine cluster protein [Methanoplanus endosymbiosus]UUX93803.1 YkgJ family cysteine cluster protein [Methanoplanus endosymbiosus]
MSFYCQQCGECCSCLGLVLVIIEQTGEYEFKIRNEYTNEEHHVIVDEDKRHLFSDRSIFDKEPCACPFLRADPENNRVCCTVHATRTEMCKSYSCWRILILDKNGKRAGRVMEDRYFSAETSELEKFRQEEIKDIREPDTKKWDRIIIDKLRKAGYTVRT